MPEPHAIVTQTFGALLLKRYLQSLSNGNSRMLYAAVDSAAFGSMAGYRGGKVFSRDNCVSRIGWLLESSGLRGSLKYCPTRAR